MNRVGKTIIVVTAAIYFLIDALFMIVAKPIGRWIAALRLFDGLRSWIVALPPYPTLALFAVPLAVLEPIKPVAACLVATGHVAFGIGVFVVGEILKLVLVERLFCMCREKLLSIPTFAWAYGKFRMARDWLEATDAWQAVRRISLLIRHTVHGYVAGLRTADLKTLMFETPEPPEPFRDEQTVPQATALVWRRRSISAAS